MHDLTYRHEHALEELKTILKKAKIKITPKMHWTRASIQIARAVTRAWEAKPDRTPKIIEAWARGDGKIVIIHVCGPGRGLLNSCFPLQALVTPPQPR